MDIETSRNNDIILIGAGGHAKVIIEAIQSFDNFNNIIGILDRDEVKIGQKLLGIPILGSDSMLLDLYNNGTHNAFISLGMISNYIPRSKLYQYAKEVGMTMINVIHKNSIISKSACVGDGNAIMAGAILNADCIIGNNCIINTGSIIEHDCIIGNNVHIGPGAKLSGQVIIEDNCMIGIGSSIIQGITVGANSIIGAGSVVLVDIPQNSVAVGCPAKVIKQRNI